MVGVAREVEHGARDYNVHRVGIVGHRLHALDAKSSRSYFRRQFDCEMLYDGDRLLALVNPPHIEAGAHEKNEIPSRAATGIEHFHSRNDPPAQQLIEQVDVDVSELFAQAVGRFAHAGAAILASSASHSATPARSPMACRMPRLC